MEDFADLDEQFFNKLKKKGKWLIFALARKTIQDLKLTIDKNCEECEKTYTTNEDVKIDSLFQDWRNCNEHCDKCNKKNRNNICKKQCNLIEYLANSLSDVQKKQNFLVQLVLKKNTRNSKMIEQFGKRKESFNEDKSESTNLFS